MDNISLKVSNSADPFLLQQIIWMLELKDLLNELRETNKLLRNALEEAQKEKDVLQQERDNFKEQVDYLTKKLFGSSSEKGLSRTIRGRTYL